MDGETFGLHYDPRGDDDLSTLRQQAQSMSNGLQLDMDRARAFTLGRTGATDVTAGLLAADDPEALAELLRERADQEPDLRLRRVVERAEHAADRGDLHAALALTDEALGLDRTNATVWLLRGRCLIGLGDFDQARQAITVAQRHARDAHGIRLADMMRTSCHQEEMRNVTAQAIELMAQGRLAVALSHVRRRLADHSDDPMLLQLQCTLLMLTGDVAAARQVAEGALRVVDPSNVRMFEEMLRGVAERECEPRIEDARLALRRGDTATAVARLDECAAALGDEANFAALRAYALKRHTEASSVKLVRHLRRRRDDSGPIDPDTLQRLIEWLLQEELDAGWAAFQAQRFADAQRQFTAAAAIDSRCALVALLHAAALYRELFQYLETARPPRLDRAHDLLVSARSLVRQCTDDAGVGAQARELGESIGVTLTAVDAQRDRNARIEAVNGAVNRFNTLMQHYQRFPIATVEQRDKARRQFDALTQEVLRLQRQRSTDAEEEAILRQLGAALSTVRNQLLRR